MDIQIRKLDPGETAGFSDLIKIFEELFEWDNFIIPARSHLQKVLSNPYFMVFVAYTKEKIIGGLSVHVLERYDSEKLSAYIYDVGVLKEFQRNGVGKLLISTVNDFCFRNGFSETFVQAETADIQALNFYRGTPVNSELQATHFTYRFDNKK